MLGSIPFSAYDFFGYLAAGTVLLTTAEYLKIPAIRLVNITAVPSGAFAVVLAYVLGQVVANFSGYLLERQLTNQLLGSPEKHLMAAKAAAGWKRRLLPGYTDPLKPATQKQVLDAVPAEVASDETRRSLFFFCWARVRQQPQVAARLETFLSLYGFCRNVSLATMICTLVVAGVWIRDEWVGAAAPPEVAWWTPTGLVVAIVLYYRYLKFYRQYTQEVFTNYAGTRDTVAQ